MKDKKTLTFSIMDGPYEQARTVTVFRLLDNAARRGYNLNVFAYEGAVNLPFSKQSKHPNAVHGHDAAEEDHPLPKDWVASLIQTAKKHGGALDWINCGLCVDERGAHEAIDGCRRGTPGDLWNWAQQSDNTLIVGTR
ncbi:MAG: tRNA 2-thiouridine synthesizing protein D [Gammaproteobacteria bacterium]|nr:MAG: tRNA 2-thiouridine synthesizing protein D [Gammaproteobacteria bacterium]TND02219.1 MAG: tRNA 2-thiouridine synthesizing protein D [Gammaproteobacteria bacterium]